MKSLKAGGYWEREDMQVAIACIEQTPAADVVEVVRCKDCKHGRKNNRIMSPEKFFKEDCVVCECEDVVGDEPMIYVPTHFCSYGTPKERGGE